jgi:hypothetical protein
MLAAVVALALGLGPPCTGPALGSTLFGLVDTGELFASTDGGVSWVVRSMLPVRDAVALQAREVASRQFLTSRSGVVYRSSDAGLTWTAAGNVPAGDVVDLQIRDNGDLLLLTASGSVFRSSDLGATFTAFAVLPGPDLVSLTQTEGTWGIYALSRTGGVFESMNLGESWTARASITTSEAIRIRSTGDDLCVLTESGDVYRSTDAGATWLAVGTLSQMGMRGFVKDGGTLVAATREGEVAASSNGSAWTWRGSINQLGLTALATDVPAAVSVEGGPLVRGLQLGPTWPNPARPGDALHVAFTLPSRDLVSLVLCDVAGRKVAERSPESFAAGPARLVWRPTGTGAGLRFLRLRTGSGAMAGARVVLLEQSLADTHRRGGLASPHGTTDSPDSDSATRQSRGRRGR